MINEGGQRLSFGVWILLHVLVFGLGIVHYNMKDNLNTARSLFGLGFGESRTFRLFSGHVLIARFRQSSLVPQLSSSMSTLRSFSSPSAATSSLSYVAPR